MTDSDHEDTGAHVVEADLDYIQLQTNLETNSTKHFYKWEVTFYRKVVVVVVVVEWMNEWMNLFNLASC